MTVMKVEYKYPVDAEGYLTDFNLFDDEWKEEKAKEAGITLTDVHEIVISALRVYFAEHNKPPMIREIARVTGIPLKRIYELFPQGPAKGAAMIAGIPKLESVIS